MVIVTVNSRLAVSQCVQPGSLVERAFELPSNSSTKVVSSLQLAVVVVYKSVGGLTSICRSNVPNP